MLTSANYLDDYRQQSTPVPGSGAFTALVETRRDRSALSKEVVGLRQQLDVQASQLRDNEVMSPCLSVCEWSLVGGGTLGSCERVTGQTHGSVASREGASCPSYDSGDKAGRVRSRTVSRA